MAKELQLALANFRDHMRENTTPACFEEEEFAAWMLHEQEFNTKPLRCFICRDCTPAFKFVKEAEGRCFQVGVDITKIVD